MAEVMDKGALYTDGQYLSKEEVSAQYNLEDIDGIWQQIQRYRSNYRFDLPVKNAQGLPYYLILTRPTLVRLSNDERLLSSLAIRLVLLRQEVGASLKEDRLLDHVKHLASYFSIESTEERLKEIVKGGEATDVDTAVLVNLVKTQESLSKSFLGSFDQALAYRINADLQGLAAGQETPQNDPKLKSLFDVIQNPDELPLLARMILILYWFAAYQPFEYSCALTGQYLAKTFLAREGLMRLPFLFDFDSITLNLGQEGEKAVSTSFKTRDLTYYLMFALTRIESETESLSQSLLNAEKESLKLNFEKPLPQTGKTVSVSKDESAHDKETAAEKEDDILPTEVENLLEAYPALNPQQADFYLSHNVVGKFYTIEMYRREEDVVYETARSSMELLTRLGFYSKSKRGRKHMFTPVPNMGKAVKVNITGGEIK